MIIIGIYIASVSKALHIVIDVMDANQINLIQL